MTDNPTFTRDFIPAIYNGEEIRIWNTLTVENHHILAHGQVESYHRVSSGDGSTGEEPIFVTPEMDAKLREVDVYNEFLPLDPTNDDVEVL